MHGRHQDNHSPHHDLRTLCCLATDQRWSPPSRITLAFSTVRDGAAASTVSCVWQHAVRRHHKLSTMSRGRLWRPHESGLGSGPGTLHPCPWLLPLGITTIRTKPLTVTREYPAQLFVTRPCRTAPHLAVLGHRLTMVIILQNHSSILNIMACIYAMELRHQIVSCVWQHAVRRHHKLSTMSRGRLWWPHESGLGSSPCTLYPCPWPLPRGITNIRTKPLTREYPTRLGVIDVRAE